MLNNGWKKQKRLCQNDNQVENFRREARAGSSKICKTETLFLGKRAFHEMEWQSQAVLIFIQKHLVV